MILLAVLSLIGSGPNWHSGRKMFVTSCQKNFWMNLLFINNLAKGMTDHVSYRSISIIILFKQKSQLKQPLCEKAKNMKYYFQLSLSITLHLLRFIIDKYLNIQICILVQSHVVLHCCHIPIASHISNLYAALQTFGQIWLHLERTLIFNGLFGLDWAPTAL